MKTLLITLLFLTPTLIHAATGEVQVATSSIIGTAGSYSGNGMVIANTVDASSTTYWDSPNMVGDWVGVDLGVGNSATLERIRTMVKSTDHLLGWHETKITGSVIQGSNSATFASGNATVDTIPAFPFNPRRQYVERVMASSTTAYRAWRLQSQNYGALAEIRFIVGAGSGFNAQPVAPLISPTGGRFRDQFANVTISSLTTSALIYYTVDGSAPTTASRLYNGTFKLFISNATTTVRAIAYDSTLATPYSEEANRGYFKQTGYEPGAIFWDTEGNRPEAHGGSILDNRTRDGYYYWQGAFTNRDQGTPSPDIPGNFGVWCYRSTDLYNWTPLGEILDNSTTSASVGVPWTYVERPHIVYNPNTSQYVLWAHGSNTHDTSDRAMTATSSQPCSGWNWVNATLNPDNLGYKDSNIFVDTDNVAYIVYTEGGQQDTYISRLNSDYLTTTGAPTLIYDNFGREAPVLFKRNSIYFLITSVGNYYNNNLTFDQKYSTSTSVTGTYSSQRTLFPYDPISTIYNGQSSFVLPITSNNPCNPGEVYIYGADHWFTDTLYESTQTWYKLNFPYAGMVNIATSTGWRYEDSFLSKCYTFKGTLTGKGQIILK